RFLQLLLLAAHVADRAGAEVETGDAVALGRQRRHEVDHEEGVAGERERLRLHVARYRQDLRFGIVAAHDHERRRILARGVVRVESSVPVAGSSVRSVVVRPSLVAAYRTDQSRLGTAPASSNLIAPLRGEMAVIDEWLPR